MNGLVQGIGPCTFETNWEIAQFRVSPAPDQSPASEVRLWKSGFPRIVGSGSKVPNRNRKGLSKADRVGLDHPDHILEPY